MSALSLALLAIISAYTAEIRLYSKPGIQAPNYEVALAQLTRGDVLIFSNGQRFTFDDVLGHGGSTMILSVNNGTRALRVPIETGFYRDSGPFTDYIDHSYEGWLVLKKSDVAVVKIFETESDPREYLSVEKLDIHFTLEAALDKTTPISPAERQRALDLLPEFAARTWEFAAIGDFRDDQIAWTGQSWVLFDFTHLMWRYQPDPPKSNDTAFDNFRLPAALRTRIEQEIMKRRACQALLTAS